MSSSERTKDERRCFGVGDALKCHSGRLRKFHREAPAAELSAELLAKEHLNVRFVVNH